MEEQEKTLELSMADEFSYFFTMYDNNEPEAMVTLKHDGTLIIPEKWQNKEDEIARRFWESMEVNGQSWMNCFKENEELKQKIHTLESNISAMEEKYLGN